MRVIIHIHTYVHTHTQTPPLQLQHQHRRYICRPTEPHETHQHRRVKIPVGASKLPGCLFSPSVPDVPARRNYFRVKRTSSNERSQTVKAEAFGRLIAAPDRAWRFPHVLAPRVPPCEGLRACQVTSSTPGNLFAAPGRLTSAAADCSAAAPTVSAPAVAPVPAAGIHSNRRRPGVRASGGNCHESRAPVGNRRDAGMCQRRCAGGYPAHQLLVSNGCSMDCHSSSAAEKPSLQPLPPLERLQVRLLCCACCAVPDVQWQCRRRPGSPPSALAAPTVHGRAARTIRTVTYLPDRCDDVRPDICHLLDVTQRKPQRPGTAKAGKRSRVSIANADVRRPAQMADQTPPECSFQTPLQNRTTR